MVKLKAKNVKKHAFDHYGCIGVSLQSPNHTGEKLAAMVEYINNNFDQCLIDLSDTLYVHHFKSNYGLSDIEAHNTALIEGERWISDNAHVINQITIPYKILRWDHWRQHDAFESIYTDFTELFSSNRIFKQAVMQDIITFYKRRYNKDVSHMHERFLSNSIRYLLEELACHTIMFNEYPCTNIYPGKQLESYRIIRDGELKDYPSGIEKSSYTRINLYVDNTQPLAA